MRLEFTVGGLTLVSESGQDDYLLASFWEDWQARKMSMNIRLTTDNEDKPVTRDIEPDIPVKLNRVDAS